MVLKTTTTTTRDDTNMNTFEGTNPEYQDEESNTHEGAATTGSSCCSRDDVAFLAEAGGQTSNRSKHYAFALLMIACLAGVAALLHAETSGDNDGGELQSSGRPVMIVKCVGEQHARCDYCTSSADGSAQCQCFEGYGVTTTEGSDAFQCLDIVECVDEHAGCHYCTSSADDGSVNCGCNAGYTTEGSDGFQCLDIVECVDEHHAGCHYCTSSADGSVNCGCNTGYGVTTTEGSDAFQCLDIVECVDEHAGCHYCTSSADGSVNCGCKTGYTTEGSDGFQCLVDTCFSGDVVNKRVLTDGVETVARVGDVDGDGVVDLVVGDAGDNEGRGAVYILFMNADNSVRVEQKISSTQGGLVGRLDEYERFGASVAGVGDMDGDGVPDLAVGAPHDDGPNALGAVYILFLNRDGSVKHDDDENDGRVMMNKISSGEPTQYDKWGQKKRDFFGRAVAGLGDLNGDGVVDLAVGPKALYIFFMNADGSVKNKQIISSPSLSASEPFLSWRNEFAESVAAVGDLKGDGTMALAVGDTSYGYSYEGDNGPNTKVGAVYILFMKWGGSSLETTYQRISATTQQQQQEGGLLAGLVPDDHRDGVFGVTVAGLGDVDGDGVPDLAVGARDGYWWWSDDAGEIGEGAVYILTLNEDGSVKGGHRINYEQALIPHGEDGISYGYDIGYSVARVGHMDGDDDGMISLGVVANWEFVVEIEVSPAVFLPPARCADGETCVNTADSTSSHACIAQEPK